MQKDGDVEPHIVPKPKSVERHLIGVWKVQVHMIILNSYNSKITMVSIGLTMYVPQKPNMSHTIIKRR